METSEWVGVTVCRIAQGFRMPAREAVSLNRVLVGLIALVLLAAVGLLRAEVFVSREEALAEAFPGQQVETETLYLSEEQASAIERLARSRLQTRIVTQYRGMRNDQSTGYAYFDTHIVRTMPETLLVVLEPDGRHRKTVILSFAEPDDYRPRPRWLKTLEGKSLGGQLWPGRGVPRITGATLTAQAMTDAVRRMLALHQHMTGTDR